MRELQIYRQRWRSLIAVGIDFVIVPDSACYVSAEVRENLEDRVIAITLTYFLQYLEKCRNDRPDSPDFVRTIDPLKAGEYSIILWIRWGGFALGPERAPVPR